MENVKIGFLPLYVKLYDDCSPEMKIRINAFAEKIANLLSKNEELEVIKGNICEVFSEFSENVKSFENAGADCIVTLHLAYSPSLESENILKNTKLPIVILDTTPDFDFTDSDDADVISYNHGIHGVQDMCNLLIRNNKQFFIEAGHYSESDVIERVIKRVKGIKAARQFQSARVGSIGGEFAGMGDFLVDSKVLEEIGVEKIELSSDDANKYAQNVTDIQIDELIASDHNNYAVDTDIDDNILRKSLRGNLAVRNWIEDKKLTAFTVNFMEVNKDFWPYGMPFAEANRAMERGIGYAGEGDVLTAAFVGAFMSISNETSFIEMFCPDWKNNLIFISHMGEMNTGLCVEKPKVMFKPMLYSDIDTTWICGTYKPGEATLVDLCPLSDGRFRIIVSNVHMKVPDCQKLIGKNICGWFEPRENVSDFLAKYSSLGGTHHLMLMYGDMKKTAETFAQFLGFEYSDIESV